MIRPSGIRPKTKPTTPAVVAATGSTSFGNWICLMSRSWRDDRGRRVVDAAVNHFQGRIAERMKSG